MSETDALGQGTGYGYDDANRLVSVTDRLGRRRAFRYDDAGRKTSEAWYSAANALVQTQTFGYDAAGNQTAATDPDGNYSITYDKLNRASVVAGPLGFTQTFAYDTAGNRVSVADSKGGATASTFDLADRLTSRSFADGTHQARLDYAYTDRGELKAVTRYADTAGTAKVGSSAYAYDDGGRVTAITHADGAGAVLADYAYAYDAADRLTQKTEGGVVTAYGYDKAGQLVQDGATVYAYDKAGNRTAAGYTTAAGNRVTAGGGWDYTYDAAGQVASKSKAGEYWAYGYDHRGQLVSAAKSASAGGAVTDAVAYQYDAWGNLVGRTQTGSAPASERYAVDGWDTAKPDAVGAENFDAVADLDAAGNVTARRVFGAGFDMLGVRVDAGGDGWYLTDRQGSVRAVAGPGGAVAGTRSYDSFGAVAGETGSGLDRYGYTGRESDPLTGQAYFRGRWADPGTGRFTTEDPIRWAAGDPNLYRYVGNSPTNATDPSGLREPPRTPAAPPRAPRDLQADLNRQWDIKERKRALGLQYFKFKEFEASITVFKLMPCYDKDPKFRALVDKLEQLNARLALPIKPNRISRDGGTRDLRDGPYFYLTADFDVPDDLLPEPLSEGEFNKLMGEMTALQVELANKAGVSLYREIDAHVVSMDPLRKMAVAVVLALDNGLIPAEIESQVRGLLSPAGLVALGFIGGTLFLGGPGAEAVVAGFGTLLFGVEVAAGVDELTEFAFRAMDAQNYDDLAWAAARFAEGVTKMGMAALGGAAGKAVGATLKGGRGFAARAYEKLARRRAQACEGVEGGRVLGASCFAAGTPLLTPGGSRPIEAFAPGDVVLSRDEHDPDGPVSAKVVEAVFERLAAVVEVHAGGRVIATTAEHPFWARGRGWVAAGDLAPGDALVGADGQATAVRRVAATGAWAAVYNLRVADWHTYFVGCDEWGFSVWAHNTCVEIRYEKGKYVLRKAADPTVIPEGEAGVRYPSMKAAEAAAVEKGYTVTNPARIGVSGDAAHINTVAELRLQAEAEFAGTNVRIHEGLTFKKQPGTGGLDRRPDVWVEDVATGRVLKVYEAARYDKAGNLVEREAAKKLDYERLGIPYHFEPVK